jgi:hypothetical protein
VLADARRGQLVGAARSGVPFWEAAQEWLRHPEHERGVKPSTLVDYRSVVNARLLLCSAMRHSRRSRRRRSTAGAGACSPIVASRSAARVV